MLTRLEAALLRPDAAAHSNVNGSALPLSPLSGDAADDSGSFSLFPESAVVVVLVVRRWWTGVFELEFLTQFLCVFVV